MAGFWILGGGRASQAREDPERHMHDGSSQGPATDSTAFSFGAENNRKWARTPSPGIQHSQASPKSTSLSPSDRSYVTAETTNRSVDGDNFPHHTYRVPTASSSSLSSKSINFDTVNRLSKGDSGSDSPSFVSARSNLSSTPTQAVNNGLGVQRGRPISRPQILEAIAGILDGHDNLVAFGTDVDAADATNITAWESYDGETLVDILARNQARLTQAFSGSRGVPESLVWQVLVSLLKATTYLHTGKQNEDDEEENEDWMPIVHNSINPSNVFLANDANDLNYIHCKLGGFSNCAVLPEKEIPRTVEERTQQSKAFPIIAIANETGFEAPELLDEVGHIPGPGSDIWSIGAVAIFMMTGSQPWDFLRETAFHAHVRRNAGTGKLTETWRDLPHQRRWKILSCLDKQAEIMTALPTMYSRSLREFVEALLFLDPDDRGTADHVLRDAIARYEEQVSRIASGG